MNWEFDAYKTIELRGVMEVELCFLFLLESPGTREHTSEGPAPLGKVGGFGSAKSVLMFAMPLC